MWLISGARFHPMKGFKWLQIRSNVDGQHPAWSYMSYSLNSLKGVIYGITWGTILVFIRGDTRSVDNGSHVQETGVMKYEAVVYLKVILDCVQNRINRLWAQSRYD